MSSLLYIQTPWPSLYSRSSLEQVGLYFLPEALWRGSNEVAWNKVLCRWYSLSNKHAALRKNIMREIENESSCFGGYSQGGGYVENTVHWGTLRKGLRLKWKMYRYQESSLKWPGDSGGMWSVKTLWWLNHRAESWSDQTNRWHLIKQIKQSGRIEGRVGLALVPIFLCYFI